MATLRRWTIGYRYSGHDCMMQVDAATEAEAWELAVSRLAKRHPGLPGAEIVSIVPVRVLR